jgi:Uma2 family endonuclease
MLSATLTIEAFTQRLYADANNDREERRLISGVSWVDYEALLADLGDSNTCRVAYLDGVVEILSTSRRHAVGKSRIGNLLELYFIDHDIEYFPTGSTTFRKQEGLAGCEPDESYCLGAERSFPDLVIEVVVTSGGLNRLALYQRIGVTEVWFWQDDRLVVYVQRGLEFCPETFGYAVGRSSELLPGLDLDLLALCVLMPSPLMAAKTFRLG